MRKLKLFFLVLVSLPLAGQDLSLTIYNSNLALVREVRNLDFSKGISRVSFTDVAANIDPTSVHFKSLTSPGKLNILEQNYEYDLVNASKIMQKYIDNEIKIVMKKGDVFSGILLSVSGNDIVLKTKKNNIQIVRGDGIQFFDFPALPEGLITRPTLNWLVNNRGERKQKTEIDYLTRGIAWHAEYVGLVSDDDKQIGLSGWVSINNQSGKKYENAKLKLIAGEVNQVQRGRLNKSPRDMNVYAKAQAVAPQFEEKEFFEYHLYTLQRPATMRDNQIKQISLFPASDSKCRKIFHFNGTRYGSKIRVLIEFDNKKTNGLGIPLPEGKVRIYKADTDGSLQFIGEDWIDHTPKNEKLRLFLGNAFDVKAERVKKYHKKISSLAHEEKYQITLKNHKKDDIMVTVTENAWSDWKIQSSSHKYSRKSATSFEFEIPVKAGEETILEYVILTQY